MLQQDPAVLQLKLWSSDGDWAGHRQVISAACPLPSPGMWTAGWPPEGACCMGPVAICMVMLMDIADCA